jgi:hypothetical protein
MAKTNPETILLRGEPNRREFEADGAITPGHLIQLDTDGKITVHGSSGGRHARLFAVENDVGGDGIDHAYAATEVVQVHAAQPGDEVYAWLADGQDIAVGAQLQSGGSGNLIAVASTNQAVGIALEALDLSASANSAAGRIKILVV